MRLNFLFISSSKQFAMKKELLQNLSNYNLKFVITCYQVKLKKFNFFY